MWYLGIILSVVFGSILSAMVAWYVSQKGDVRRYRSYLSRYMITMQRTIALCCNSKITQNERREEYQKIDGIYQNLRNLGVTCYDIANQDRLNQFHNDAYHEIEQTIKLPAVMGNGSVDEFKIRELCGNMSNRSRHNLFIRYIQNKIYIRRRKKSLKTRDDGIFVSRYDYNMKVGIVGSVQGAHGISNIIVYQNDEDPINYWE